MRSFFERYAQDYLITQLCKGLSKDKRKLVAECKVIVHFLRCVTIAFEQLNSRVMFAVVVAVISK